MSFIVSEAVDLYGPRLEKIKHFLGTMGLRYEGDAEYTVFLTDDDGEILGSGSLCGSVLKYIAVADSLQGEGGAAAIVSRLVQYAYLHGRKKLFLFTKPKNEPMFRSLGFFALAETRDVIYMENSRSGLKNYLDSLEKGSGVQGAIVANCNPFTLGHQYLMEKAAGLVDTLHVFIVSENKSEFPFDVRFELVKKGTAHIKNLILHESGDYIISHATFPTYFIKSSANANMVNAELDLTLFCLRIAPALGITKRFVGTEPFCKVTREYNERMKQLLPDHGIEVIEIPRKDDISASSVRNAIANWDTETLRMLLPDVTFDYITSNLLNK
ncbi:MAG: [citrate (pro-3S)-lyase] ligase [Christensenellaceae bacterium]|nr:[citrate (pro-3S)-lyase] ligase [Christensenellaceae bacterium]